MNTQHDDAAESLVREALQKGVPLHEVEDCLDRLDFVKQQAERENRVSEPRRLPLPKPTTA